MTDTSLVALHNILFEQIDRLNDTDLTDEELDHEVRRAGAMEGIARAMTENARIMLRSARTANAPAGLLPDEMRNGDQDGA